MNNYPKILIISGYDILNAPDATSITIRSLINGWPKERICEIYCGMYDNDKLIMQNPQNRLKLSVDDVEFGGFLSKLREKRNKVLDSSNQINEHVFVRTQNFKQQIKQKLKFILSATADMFPYRTNLVDAFIDEQKPDVIYVIPYGKRILDLTLYLQETYDIPVITHIMDDWATTIYNDSYSTLFQRKLTLSQFDKLIKISKHVFVISDAMKVEYEKRYPNIKYSVFMNSPQIKLGTASLTVPVIKLACIGSLHLNRWQSLLEFSKIIFAHKLELTIDIYSSDWEKVKHHFIGFDFIKSNNVLANDQISRELEKFDGLLFLESFDPSINKYTKYSVSTKIPEYLGAQKPIIAIGPSNIASIAYLKKNKAALVLDDTNIGQWNDILSISLSDTNKLNEVLNNAKELFQRNHNADTIKFDFYNAVKYAT